MSRAASALDCDSESLVESDRVGDICPLDPIGDICIPDMMPCIIPWPPDIDDGGGIITPAPMLPRDCKLSAGTMGRMLAIPPPIC